MRNTSRCFVLYSVAVRVVLISPPSGRMSISSPDKAWSMAIPEPSLPNPWALEAKRLWASVRSLSAVRAGDRAKVCSLYQTFGTPRRMAIALMFSLRCLHPPGGATALLAAMSAANWSFAFFP
ncbi:MAG: HPP family protein, partial [Burkholderiaceae bacterium]|nr:HPP family protein [Burkholderiaceae bacterium]